MTIGQDGNPLVMLIAILLIVFVLLSLIKVIYMFSQNSLNGEWEEIYGRNILRWVSVPADPAVLLTRPWTVLTYMFVHDGVWHILGNLLWLWAFGFILQDLTGSRMVLPIFIYSAFAGAFFYLLSYNLVPALRSDLANNHMLGASAGVMGIAIATTAMAPNFRIFPMLNGGIPLWVITVIFVVIDLATLPYSNPGGHIAHLAGAGFGYLFVYMLGRGHDWSKGMNNFFSWVNNLFNPDKPKKGKSAREQLYYKSKVAPFKRTTTITQQRIDEILDKIGQKGYNALTD
ncbi:MAG TPA: rhomboid family intramembrane serine protease, partial [Chitinophagaceae bacterium]|nr:rhomboid family intramembrane serine protease [Chitinophagaceae bacterium]